jgi:hypothetical protein
MHQRWDDAHEFLLETELRLRAALSRQRIGHSAGSSREVFDMAEGGG